MPRLNILHLTDVHLGMRGTPELWPQAKAVFFQDLEFLVGEAGEVGLVALTGDIAFQGGADEYLLADEFVLELMDWFADQPLPPQLVVVPGNHDLARPPSSDGHALNLRQSWDVVKQDFWASECHPGRSLVSAFLASFSEWSTGIAGYFPSRYATGLLPGDFTASISAEGVQIGLLGLNTTFRHLSDNAREGDVSVSGTQIQAAAGGDLPTWAMSHDTNILLTHHPPSWLDLRGKEDVKNLVLSRPNRFHLHLCGHLHAGQLDGSRLGADSRYYTIQSPSLFGLEHWGRDDEERRFGYTLVTVDLSDEIRSVSVWPRQAYKQDDGEWQLDVARSGIHLPKGSPFSDPLPLPNAPGKRQKPEAPSTSQITAKTRGLSDPGPHFIHQLESGRFVLVVGDGVQRGALSASGDRIACNSEIREIVASFAGVVLDPSADLAGLYRLALRRNKAGLLDALSAATTVEESGPVSSALAEVPFKEIYDLTLADALEGALMSGRQRGKVESREISTDFPLARDPSSVMLLNVHGTALEPHLERHAPGERSTNAAQWYSRIGDMLASYPVLFVADDVDAWDLWGFVALRGAKPSGSEIRPRSYLLTPDLSSYRRELLADFNVEWLQATPDDLAASLTTDMRDSVRKAQAAQASQARRPEASGGPQLVARARDEATVGSRSFLLGHEPTWGDALGKHVVIRSAEDELLELLNKCRDRSVIVFGTAGSGKSTLMRRAAITLDAAGETVVWIDRSVRWSLADVANSVRRHQATVVMIDDVDIFGPDASRFVGRLSRDGFRVVASVRSTRQHVLQELPERDDFWLDRLTDTDVARITRALRQANLLGRRFHATDTDLRALFERAERQLLVAMIELTTGTRFRDKIAQEFLSLDDDARMLYGSIALINHLDKERATRDFLRLAMGFGGTTLHRALTRLVSQKLVVEVGGEEFALRHFLIADEMIPRLADCGLLPTIVGDLLVAAGTAHARDRQMFPDARLYDRATTRLMIRLLRAQSVISGGMFGVMR